MQHEGEEKTSRADQEKQFGKTLSTIYSNVRTRSGRLIRPPKAFIIE